MLIRSVLFFISEIGVWELLRRKTKIHVYFLPSMTIAIQVSILFVGGILNLLHEIVIALFAIGCINCVFVIIKDKGLGFIRRHYFNVGFIVFFVSCTILIIFLYGKHFYVYDDFSHWALVVKQMLNTNRFPNFVDENIILFQQYPLGCSSYVYFMTSLVSPDEWFQMFAKEYMIIASILPVFLYYHKRRQVISLVIIFLLGSVLFLFLNEIESLCVDTVLPVVTVCALIYLYNVISSYTKESIRNNKELSYQLFMITFYLIEITQIKQSGLFFSFLIVLCIIILQKKIRIKWSSLGCIIILPILYCFIWDRHCRYVYSNSISSGHAMTIEYYTSIFNEKTTEQIKDISYNFLKFIFSSAAIHICLIFLLIVYICLRIAQFNRGRILKGIGILIGWVTLYLIGELGMYFFSMPVDYAINIPGATRYTKTIITAVLYMGAIYLLIAIKATTGKRAGNGICLISILTMAVLLYVSCGDMITIPEQRESRYREWMNMAISKYDIPNNKSYCILYPKDGRIISYYTYMGRYIFGTTDVKSISVKNIRQLENLPYEYVFIMDKENEIIDRWVKEYYSDQYGNDVIILDNE